MTKYKHLFFDLDHTLWDYDRNVQESLTELFELYKLRDLGIPTCEDLFCAFNEVNYKLWALFNVGEIGKEDLRKQRFKLIFEQLGVDGLAVPLDMEEDFMFRTSSKPHLFPHSKETLTYLQHKYELHIITNGFNESQARKMSSSGLTSFFEMIITSETMGHRKPDKRIFEYAIGRLDTDSSSCLMIGDNPDSDILGAQNAGIDQVLFNPLNIPCALTPTYTIVSLQELREFL